MVVCKFGGSATANKVAIENIKNLAKEDCRGVFIFSAIGKERKNDKKITDLLIEYTQENANKKIIINKIKNKFNKLLIKTQLNLNINKKIDKIIKKYEANKDFDYLISRGEYLTAFIMGKYLNIPFVPAEKIIFFKNKKINFKKIKNKINFYLNKYKKMVIPGFYGVNQNNKIKLLSRGGSDVSGAIVARVLSPCIYENWTDVSGIKEVNPKFLNSHTIAKMSYRQLKVITNCDARVVHGDCANILKKRGVVLKVKNILKPLSPYTEVTDCKTKAFFVCYKQKGDRCVIFSLYKKEKTNVENLKEKIITIYNKGR